MTLPAARRRRFILSRAPRSLADRAVQAVLFLCALASVLATAGIVVVIAVESADFFRAVGLGRFLGDALWAPLSADPRFGLWPLLAGTLVTTAIAITVALPFGLLAAIYLSEFASKKARRFLKPTLDMIAGVPTVVYGYFALAAITPALARFVPGIAGPSALSAGLAMGIMILPLVASRSDDALSAVPASLREGAYALGAGKLATTTRVVLPTALSGIGAAVVLGVARGVGETMIVTIAAGSTPNLALDPRAPVQTLTTFLAQASLRDVHAGTLAYSTIFAVGAALLVFTLALDALASRLGRRRSRGAR